MNSPCSYTGYPPCWHHHGDDAHTGQPDIGTALHGGTAYTGVNVGELSGAALTLILAGVLLARRRQLRGT